MAKRSRLILTPDGERSFAQFADSLARNLDHLLRLERVKKRELADRAHVDQAVVSRVLDGTRNLETRTVGALYGALGYAIEVTPRRIRTSGSSNSSTVRPDANSQQPDSVIQGGNTITTASVQVMSSPSSSVLYADGTPADVDAVVERG